MEKYILRSFFKGSKHSIDLFKPSLLGSTNRHHFFLLRFVIMKADKTTKTGRFPLVTEDNTIVADHREKNDDFQGKVHALEPFWGSLN